MKPDKDKKTRQLPKNFHSIKSLLRIKEKDGRPRIQRSYFKKCSSKKAQCSLTLFFKLFEIYSAIIHK
jgi:hypothetical protein